MHESARCAASWLLLAVAGLAGCAGNGLPRATTGDAAGGFRERADLLASQAHGDEPEAGTAEALDAAIADPLFAGLPAATQGELLAAAGRLAAIGGRPERARDLLVRAVAAEPGQPGYWHALAWLERSLGRNETAAAHLAHLVRQWPAAVAHIDVDLVHGLVMFADFDAPERLDLMQGLFDADWRRQHPAASHVWFELALALVEQGRMEQAATVVERIRRASELIQLRSDRRFDPIVDPGAPRFDVERAADDNVLALLSAAGSSPPPDRVFVDLGHAMLTAGLHAELIDMTDELLAALDRGEDLAVGADDLPWLLNHKAIALRRIGSHETATALLQHAGTLPEHGGRNTSQLLNLGIYYCDLARPDDALAAIAGVGPMSGYGAMVRAGVQARAALLGGDAAGFDRALGHLASHRDDGPNMYLDVLIHAGRLDEAAELLIDLLASRKERAGTLLQLQQRLQPAPLPGETAYFEGRARLLARDDVADAIARVGRIASYRVH